MPSIDYFSFPDAVTPVELPFIPNDATIFAAKMDDSIVKDCIFNQSGWYTKPFFAEGLIKHDSDELLVFAGGDVNDAKNLGADIEIQVENDIISIKNTCVVYIPAGAAHGNLRIKSIGAPVFYYVCHIHSGTYSYEAAEATADKGMYASNKVEGYLPDSGIIPDKPPGLREMLIWLDGKKVSGAPYMETLWYKDLRLDPGPPAHVHEDFDELIGFIGSDPNNPAELGAEVFFDFDGESVAITKSCIAFIPRGIVHSPMMIQKMDRPIYHFTMGNGVDYVRGGKK